MGKLNLRLMYPKSDEYEYETRLEKINLDKERESDILNNKGFIVSKYQGVKKDMKNPFSIFSSKFGQTLKDLNPFANRYKCQCGHTMSRINHNTKCKVCGKRVRYVDDDFEYFGWIVLQNYYIIHPNIYKSIAYFIGKDLKDILEFKKITDIDGHIHNVEIPEGKSPYYGIGMIEFKEKFEEIMEYYKKKNPGKIEYYEDIMLNKDKVFIQSIPVYTTHLRPFNADQTSFYYENANAKYMIMNKLVSDINLNDNRMDNTIKPKDQKLYDLQLKYNDLYKSIEDTLSTKRGNIRTLFGGRYNFSSRDVIVPNPELRIDQVTLPYAALVNLLQQSIINILHKMYNMSYSDAYTYWYKATINKNETVVNIIKSIINNKPRGLELIINRNPTISYGGILQMHCIGMTDNYTMGIPLQILPLLAADFDGDVLNVLYIINKDFYKRAFMIFNPRNAMYISRNDGKFEDDVNHQRDTIINSNTLVRLSRKNYSKQNMNNILAIKAKWN